MTLPIFEVTTAYIAKPDEIVCTDDRCVYVEDFNYETGALLTRGLQPYYFAIFGQLMTNRGFTQEDYLVTDYEGGLSELITSTELLADPSTITPHLEMLMRRAGRDEIMQFTIGSLIARVFGTNSKQ